jgi:hypothetical protein
MRFVFQKMAVYERAQTDNGIVTNRQSVQNAAPSTESLDVDFANAQGKIFNKTEFDFGLTRTRGYEAGEYTLQIRTADGVDIGSKMNLTLKGENPIVDRRSITFEAKKKGIEKVDDGSGGDKNKPAKSNENADVPAAGGGSGEVAPSGSSAPFIPQSAYEPTEEEKIKEKPKGCGCTVPGGERRSSDPSHGGSAPLSADRLWLVGGMLAAFGLVAARRRVRRRG